MSLQGKVAIVTGGSKGIGKATALKLVKEGASVVINYGSDSKAADDVVAQVGKNQALAVQADAGNVASLEQLVSKTVERFGKIDILVANAGVMPNVDLMHMTEEVFNKVFNLNVKGPMFLAQKAVPHMASGSGIILISTSLNYAQNILPGQVAYISSKGAIDQMTRVLAKDLAASRGIRVNAVAPGPTGTELFFEGKSEQLLNMIKSLNPFNRLGTPEEIADVIAFLSADGSRWMNGQTIRVNGGHA